MNAASVLRGIIGFTLVSVGGFAPWPIFERWFRSMGEMDLYIACLVMFIGLSGVCLHRLIIGPGSLPRFYKLFSLAFTAYAVAWVAIWVWLRGNAGGIGGFPFMAKPVSLAALTAMIEETLAVSGGIDN